MNENTCIIASVERSNKMLGTIFAAVFAVITTAAFPLLVIYDCYKATHHE